MYQQLSVHYKVYITTPYERVFESLNVTYIQKNMDKVVIWMI